MKATRETLIRRLRDTGDQPAWEEFFALYAPLMFGFARSRGLSEADAEEVRDQCLEIVARKMPAFEYQRREGGFRSWLFTIISARIVDMARRRRAGRLETRDVAALADGGIDPAAQWDARWRQEHLAWCLERARWKVSTLSYRAFELLLFGGRSVQAVCEELGMNENQVYKAKHRVLQEVRASLQRLGEE